jgi:hypothetical protein
MVSACILEFLYLVPVADIDVVAAKRLGSLEVGDPARHRSTEAGLHP